MNNKVWIVYDAHDEQVDICADEMTAYAVKKHYDWKFIEPCYVREQSLTTREDVESIVVFEPEFDDVDDVTFSVEVRYDA